MIDDQTPAVKIGLKGRYLIEASAGTGKTWTLTGIVLRLLIEAGRPSEHIIATTFTRAAAAEMRERIRARLLDFYQLAQWVNLLRSRAENLAYLYSAGVEQITNEGEQDQDSDDDCLTHRKQWLLAQAKLAGMAESLEDPVNWHLIWLLLDDEGHQPLQVAIKRTATALTTLDKMFVGTLDSLAQKWLIEYSSETGFQKGMQISEDESDIIDTIIHDELRAFQSEQYHNYPIIYQMLQANQHLTGISDHRHAVNRALSFLQAPIDLICDPISDKADVKGTNSIDTIAAIDSKAADKPQPVADLLHNMNILTMADGQSLTEQKISDFAVNFDFAAYEQLIARIIDNHHQADDYLTEKGIYHETTKSRSQLKNNSFAWVTIIEMLQQQGIYAYNSIMADNYASKLCEALQKTDNIGSQFYAPHKDKNIDFNQLPVIIDIKQYLALSKELEHKLDMLIYKLNRHIALTVRRKLPAILEARHETTFSLQMARLNEALSGVQGRQLAQYIRHHYPVALVDESQDINGEQAAMIEAIYLSHSNKTNNDNNDKNKGFVLLVGDPKQAIYGFRGGDVANYNVLKQRFNNEQIMTLDVNRRSNARLIEALNHWFDCADADGADTDNSEDSQNSQKNGDSDDSEATCLLAELGDKIYYRHITAHRQLSSLSWQQPLNNECSDKLENKAQHSSQSPQNGDSTNTNIFSKTAVTVLQVSYPSDKKNSDAHDIYKVLAQHIAHTLQSSHTIDGRRITANDIAVLGAKKHQLKQAESELRRLDIATNKIAEVSIFATAMAIDLVAILEAMMMPYRTAVLNRALMSRFFGLTMVELNAMTAGEQGAEQAYNLYQQHFRNLGRSWQRYGILSALQQLLSQQTLNSQLQQLAKSTHLPEHVSHASVWEYLSSQIDGERLLVDLRQLLDILAQQVMGMREYQIIDWLKQQLGNLPLQEWAVQQPIGSQNGVQMMTIHKSKGLEFPIVYVLGMDDSAKGARGKYPLYLYDNGESDPSLWQRRLSPVAQQVGTTTVTAPMDYAAIEQDNNLGEFKRLGYVAFTRASEQLYILVADDKETGTNQKLSIEQVHAAKYKFTPMKHWLHSHERYTIPDRLHTQVAAISGETIINYTQLSPPVATESLNLESQPTLSTTDTSLVTSEHVIDYQPVYDMMQKKSFQGWSKTSFTALARSLSEQRQDLAINDSGFAEKGGMDDMLLGQAGAFDFIQQAQFTQAQQYFTLYPEQHIRFTFVKGANAGSFLHHIFEHIDFSASYQPNLPTSTDRIPKQWSQVIDKALMLYHLPNEYASPSRKKATTDTTSATLTPTPIPQETDVTLAHEQLCCWINDVLHAPLLASGKALAQIEDNKRLAEMGFNMSLKPDFEPEQLNTIFRQYLPNELDKHIHLRAHEEQGQHYLYRFLRGEIDLVYEQAGKYYIVDYKSNHLGNSLSNYNQTNLTNTMQHAGYWLQAAIYQLALHRYLKMRLKDYTGNEEKYLGGVEYLFLRGATDVPAEITEHEPQLASLGRIVWLIPIELIYALDDVFGYAGSA
ncbi:UvrD-helicase domain-containing protein [Psychrobacter sp. I-STPA10]|uniref:UvrD-helicase domain-containing protein n=1 Tax=Psychrobacter sp. I-STPA10 TaxID=2585769 RepID=UPI001E475840|nr:UvrD-helicase domain-containing protein [Psychrobacter sp. I-STPA10]